jgi:hypothetical protein
LNPIGYINYTYFKTLRSYIHIMVKLGFLGNTIKVAGHKIPILYPLLAVGVVGLWAVKKKSGSPVSQGPAPDVQFNLNPPSIMPNVPTMLTGQFQTLQGMPVTVPAGYFYIFLIQPNGMKQLLNQGTLGMNISKFSVPLNTQGLMPAGMGKYSLTVTDTALTQQELA